jgi:hypothetical protein
MKNKIKNWIKRYGPAEIIGTVCAVFFSVLAYSLTKNNIIAALAGAWSETIAFFGTMIVREVYDTKKEYKEKNKQYTVTTLLKNIRDIVFEFGFSEILDTYAVRPYMMYIFPIILGNRIVGVLVGKIISDLIYYGPAIISYELRQKYKNRKKS